MFNAQTYQENRQLRKTTSYQAISEGTQETDRDLKDDRERERKREKGSQLWHWPSHVLCDLWGGTCTSFVHLLLYESTLSRTAHALPYVLPCPCYNIVNVQQRWPYYCHYHTAPGKEGLHTSCSLLGDRSTLTATSASLFQFPCPDTSDTQNAKAEMVERKHGWTHTLSKRGQYVWQPCHWSFTNAAAFFFSSSQRHAL